MVGHQYIRVNGTTGSAAVFLHPLKIKGEIFVSVKAGLTIVASLDDMEWCAWHDQAGSSWHDRAYIMGTFSSLLKKVVCPHFLTKARESSKLESSKSSAIIVAEPKSLREEVHLSLNLVILFLFDDR